MAGKHRAKPDSTVENTAQVKLRIPEALKVHLEDQALAHGRSLNEEIKDKLMRPSRPRRDIKQWQALLALEPGPNDTRTPREIALQIARIKGEQLPAGEPDDSFDDVEIDWLPGSSGDLWNQASPGQADPADASTSGSELEPPTPQ